MHNSPHRYCRRHPLHLLLSAVFFPVLAVQSAPTTDIYRYHGLKAADTAAAEDGVYQDFSHDGDNVGKMWSDPDGSMHGSNAAGWVRAEVLRNEALPYLRLEFDRAGYGVNTGVSPKMRVPEKIPAQGMLVLELRSSNGICAGLRIMERDGEIWGYGKPGLNYERFCLPAHSDWTEFRVPLTERTKWFKFPYDGNIDLGNNQFEADLLASLSFELGTYKDHHIGKGSATLDIRNIRVMAE